MVKAIDHCCTRVEKKLVSMISNSCYHFAGISNRRNEVRRAIASNPNLFEQDWTLSALPELAFRLHRMYHQVGTQPLSTHARRRIFGVRSRQTLMFSSVEAGFWR